MTRISAVYFFVVFILVALMIMNPSFGNSILRSLGILP